MNVLTMVGWAMAMLLHPGHSTRVEVQFNPQTRMIELAMRIDHGDLEAALTKRYDRSIAVEQLTDEQAAQWVAPYLQQTLRLNHQKIPKASFRWLGWERKRLSTWVYAELAVDQFLASQTDQQDVAPQDPAEATITLSILTLLDVEPDLNHVVAVIQDDQRRSTVTSKQKPTVAIPLSATSGVGTR